jgi:uncharacterized Zn finger protein (UPF0148 family)
VDREAVMTAFVATCAVEERGQTCDAPTQDFLCEKHRDELLDWLRDVGGIRLGDSGQYSQSLLQDLDDAICGDTKMGGAPIGILVSSAEEPVPFNNHASDAKHTLVNTVGTWARMFAEENPHLTLDATTIEDAARWMVQFPNLIAGHPAAVEMHADVREAVGGAHRSIDRPADRVFAGRCDFAMNGEVCNTRLFALEHRHEVVCPVCGTEYWVEDRRAEIEKALRSERATAKTITDALRNFANVGINVKSIRTWARRGLIRNYASEGETPVHEIGETLDFARSVKATVEASCAEAA